MSRITRPQVRRRRSAAAWVVVAAIALFEAPGAGQQPPAPQTGAPRHLWPQRPGVFGPLNVDTATPPVQLPVIEPAQAAEPEFVPNEVLVQFEPDVAEADRASMRSAVQGTLVRTLRPDGRLERLQTPLPVTDAVAILQQQPRVEFAEPNWIVRATFNDPAYQGGLQWGMYGDVTTPANPFGSQAGEAWAAGLTGSRDVYVAVIDEGIDVTHPDLAPNIWTNPFDPINGLDDDGNGYVDDVNGWDFFHGDNSVFHGFSEDSHGTHVAGILGARGGDGFGVAGVSWNVTIISAKILSARNGTIESAVLALDYITDLKVRHGLNIVATNNSWGGSDASTALHQAIVRAAKEGILFVAAAGNLSRDTDTTPHFPSGYSTLVPAGTEPPASFEAIISVAAISDTGGRAPFSNYGIVSVDIGAPGDSVYSTLPGGVHGYMGGTSMAAPHVTGAIALYTSAHRGASAAEIRSAILGLGVPTAALAGFTHTGKRLDVSTFAAPFQLSIGDTSVLEGDSGSRQATFQVALSAPATSAVHVRYRTSDGTATNGATLSNTGTILIPSSGAASPYPSPIGVPAGLGTITKVKIVISGLTHATTSDLDVLLAGPGGQTCLLMSDVPATPMTGAVDLTLVFDDEGPPMPGGYASGTYRPTNNTADDLFAFPAPAGPYGSSLSVFNGTDPAGTWRLFVVDDLGGNSGVIAGGWSLLLNTTSGDYVASDGTLTIPAGSTSASIQVPVLGDFAVEPSETFSVQLVDADGAAIADGAGVATIRNDDFTDVSLSGLPIKAIHILELRAAIDEARTAKGLPAYAFVDPGLAAGTRIQAIHIMQLRDALTEAYAKAGLQAPAFTDQPLTPGVTTIKAAHITEIRAALLALP